MSAVAKLTVNTPSGEVIVPFLFGIGAFEQFCESRGIDDPSKIGEALSRNPLKAAREFMLVCYRYYYDVYGGECPFTEKDFVRFIDLTGGFRSTFRAEFEAAMEASWGDPATAEIVDTAGQATKN